MAQALIQSQLNGAPSTVVDGQSRNDLSIGDKVHLKSIGSEADTFSWSILYRPEGSLAQISGNPTSASPGYFETDKEGSYLVRLIVNAGIAGEDTQYLRIRALTVFGGLHLVAAGERKTFEDVIPSDIEISGWTNDQNRNFLTLLGFLKPLVSSGRVLYVDANNNTQGHGDFSSIQDAINHALSVTPDEEAPYAILVHSGVYPEDLVLHPHIHLVGLSGDTFLEDKRVVLQGRITTNLSNTGEKAYVSNFYIEGVGATSSPLVEKTGDGVLGFIRSMILQNASSVGQGATIEVSGGVLELDHCKVVANETGLDAQTALVQKGLGTSLNVTRTEFVAPSCVSLNPDRHPAGSLSAKFASSVFHSTGGLGSVALTSQSQAQFDHCLFNVDGGKAVSVNPTGGSLLTGDIILQFRWSYLATEVLWNIDDTNGRNEIRVGAIHWGGLQESGILGNPAYGVKITPLVGGDTIGYDGVASADNIQDAIDATYSLTNITGSNVGAGTRVFKQKTSNFLEFKTLVGDSTVSVSSTSDEIQLSFSGGISSVFQDNTSLTIVDDGFAAGNILINVDGTDYWMFDSNGSFLPMNTGTQDIGSVSNRVQSVYVDAISSVHFVHDDGATQFDYPLNIDVSDPLHPELCFNGVPIANSDEKFFEVAGTDIGWYNEVKLVASPLRYVEGLTGIPVLLIQDTTMAGTSVKNDTGQAINLKKVLISFMISGESGTIDDTVLTEIVVDVYVGNEEASFTITGYSFDLLQEIELSLDISNVLSEEQMRVEIFFIRDTNSSIEIPVLPLGVRFGYYLQ